MVAGLTPLSLRSCPSDREADPFVVSRRWEQKSRSLRAVPVGRYAGEPNGRRKLAVLMLARELAR
jgi:hypothetical protein